MAAAPADAVRGWCKGGFGYDVAAATPLWTTVLQTLGGSVYGAAAADGEAL